MSARAIVRLWALAPVLAIALSSGAAHAADADVAAESAPTSAPGSGTRLTLTAAGGAEKSRLFDFDRNGGFGAIGIGVTHDGVVRALGEVRVGSGRADALTTYSADVGFSVVWLTRYRFYGGLAGSGTWLAFSRATTHGIVGSFGVGGDGVAGADVLRFDNHSLAIEARAGGLGFPETAALVGRLSLVGRY